MTSATETKQFIICRQCACMSFNELDVQSRYCSICNKTHQSEDDYYVAEGLEDPRTKSF